MPQEGYTSVSIRDEDMTRAESYKPTNSTWTWSDALVAGAERLNDDLDSDTRRFADDITDIDALAEALAASLEGDADGGADAIARAVVEQFDYAEVAARTADEVERRLR